MRRVFALCLAALGCSSLNAEYDPLRSKDATGDASDASGAIGSTGITSNPDSDTTSRSTIADTAGSSDDQGAGDSTGAPVDPTCPHASTRGLALVLGDPSVFGDNCPDWNNVWARPIATGDGEMTMATCSQGCVTCTGEHPLSTFPLLVNEYVPMPGEDCVLLETTNSLGQEEGRCVWGSLTIRDALTNATYLVATAQSFGPTPTGAEILEDAIPPPQKAAGCDCATLDADVCCEGDPPPAEFWAYDIDAQLVFAGDSVPLAIASQPTAVVFEVFQAEAIPTCDGQQLQLSWAVH